jgi:DNA gyrase subunit A
VLTEQGFGKRVALRDFMRKHRGTQGVRLLRLAGKKTGPVAAVRLVREDDEELLLISKGGQVVRTDVKSINRYGPDATGVKVMTTHEGDVVAGIAVFRAGLAEQRGIGDNGETEDDAAPAGGDGPDGQVP